MVYFKEFLHLAREKRVARRLATVVYFKKFLHRESSIEHAFFESIVARRLATDFRRLLSRREAPRDRF